MPVAEEQTIQRERQHSTYPETKSPGILPLESGDHVHGSNSNAAITPCHSG